MKSFRAHVLFLIFAACIQACSFKSAVLVPVSPKPKLTINEAYVFLILMDGARPDTLEALVESGRLPTIKELFFEQGARFENALTVLPTASTPAHQAFISGLFPGHHGIPSLDWYSRAMGKHIDYLKPKDISLTNTYMFNFLQVREGKVRTDQPQLIYHDLDGYPTLSVFETAVSGVSERLPKHPPFLTAYHGKIEKFYENFDIQAQKLSLEKLRSLAPQDLPRFSYISFYGMDLVSHFAGSNSDRVSDLFLQYDRFLGELRQILSEKGIWDKTSLILISDHGQHPLNKSTDLPALLRRAGLAVRPKQLNQSQVIYGDHGLGIVNLYFKVGQDWKQRPSYFQLQNYPTAYRGNINLIEAFKKEPDIEWVLVPEGRERVHIYRREQHASIELKEENGQKLYRYQADLENDPLELLSDSTIRNWVETGNFQNAEAWLKQTHDKKFPDSVVQVTQMFEDYRFGDMALLTVKESQFKENRISGHGSLHGEDMRIILMAYGPSIKPGLYPYARSVDVYPLLLALYGLPATNLMDGTLRSEILKNENLQVSSSNPESSYSLAEFQRKLEAQLNENQLSSVEREKAQEILDSLKQYQSHPDLSSASIKPMDSH